MAGVITVRFPSGFSVQYNSAVTICGPDAEGIVRLRAVKKSNQTEGDLIARVPKECLIEFVSPCRTYNAAKEESDAALKQQIEQLRKEVRSLTRKMGKLAK